MFPHDLQAFGNNFLAAAVMAGTLVWYLLHPLEGQKGAQAGSLSASGGLS
jgi:hypothetical protein